MKKILFILAISISALSFSQSAKTHLVMVDGAITSEAFMKSIDSKKIKSVNIYKNNIPNHLKEMADVAKSGIIDIKMKEQSFDRISFAELNDEFKLPAENPVSFDGFLIKDTKMIVLADAILSMKVKNLEGKDILHLSTTTK